MSTILKALRRLEEDSPTNTSSSSGALPATDPLAADELRDRILAEEFAAQAAAVAQHESGRTRRFVMLGVAGLLTVVVGVGAYMMSTGTPSDQSAERVAETPPPPSRPAPVATPQVEEPRAGEALVAAVAIQPVEDQEVIAPVPEPASIGTPPVQEDEMALVVVTPTQSTLEANADRQSPAPETVLAEAAPQEPSPRPSQPARSRPRPTVTTPSPPSVSAPKPAAAVAPAPPVPSSPAPSSPVTSASRSSSRSTPSVRKAEPAKSRVSPEIRQVDHHESPNLAPDLTITRISWHPRADRRSAKIRLKETEEVLTLREGDAVGGLVIQEISPSAVVFKSGEVEIHRRVGQPGSGG